EPIGLPGDREGRHRDAGRPPGDQPGRPRHRAVRPVRPGRGGGPRSPQLPAPRAHRRPVRRGGQLPDGLKGMTTMNVTVKDVMITEVVAVRRENTFKEMAAVLRRYRV